VRNVSNSLEDVENLLGTLVDISKLDAGVIKADIAPFALSELLDNLAAEYTQVARSEGLELHFVGCSALVRSDIQLLARILRNLLSNAIRYTYRARGAGLSAPAPAPVDSGVGQRHGHCRKSPGGDFPGVQARRCAASRPGPRARPGPGDRGKDRRHSRASDQVRSWPGKGSMFCVEVPLSATAPQAQPAG
jgi:hypothetical protein